MRRKGQSLSRRARPERPIPQPEVVVVLDNAGFHRAKLIKVELETWAAKGLTLWFQSPYSPQFVLDKAAPSGPVCNPIETVWKKLKGFLYAPALPQHP